MSSAVNTLTIEEREVAPCSAFDVYKVREDFPILEQKVRGKPLVYLDNAATTQKPQVVIGSMQEFSKPQYGVDIMKVEVPITMAFVKGARSCKGESAYTRDEAKEYFRKAAAVAKKPFIYLSAGVSNDTFSETLDLAAESGVNFSGVLCGRATWKEGIPVYAKQGLKALEDWLADQGVKNIQSVNARLKAAKPWYSFYGVESAAALR